MIKNAKCIWCNKDVRTGYEIKNTGINGTLEEENHPYFLLEFHKIDPVQECFSGIADTGWNRTLFSEIICKDCIDVLTKYLKLNKENKNESKNNN